MGVCRLRSLNACLFYACVDCECSKRDIAESNYVIHEVHCRRNIVLCEQCSEPVPRVDLETHIKEIHAPITCELCNLAVERHGIERHKVGHHMLTFSLLQLIKPVFSFL